jgi:hypothetical protein
MTPMYGSKQMPIKTRAWLEAECLKLARQISGGSQIECVMIRRLYPKGVAPNWKIADIIPQPRSALSDEIRATLAHLPGTYALGDDALGDDALGDES